MVRLYKHILLFFLPVVVLLFFLPLDKRLQYQELKDDCFNQALWIHDRIFKNPKDIDIVFLGTSHTVNAIHESLIEDALSAHDLQAANFGYCRIGRNLHYALLQDVLEGKKPRYLMLEVTEDEKKFGHPVFAHMARSKDVAFAYPFFNRDIIADMYDHLAYKVAIYQDVFFTDSLHARVRMNDHGWATSADTIVEEEILKAREKGKHADGRNPDFIRWYNMHFSRTYLSRIVDLCESRDMEIIFYYMPAFASYYEKPKQLDHYAQYGKVLIAPRSMYEDPDNWYDRNHLNQAGADKFSAWLAGEIKSSL